MKKFTSLVNEKIEDGIYTAVSVGKFEGIHRGHRLLVDNILARTVRGYKSLIVTFDKSPRITLNKDSSKLIVTENERDTLLEIQGIDYLLEAPFVKEIKDLDAKEFIKYLYNNFGMRYFTCGTDFHFGKMGAGDVNLLGELAVELGFELEIVDKLQADHKDVSSTFVRSELLEGNVKKAAELLGYNYFITGEIVHGKHLGHKLGFPTINIDPEDDKLLPSKGVYITTIRIDDNEYYGMTNVGTRPTVSDKDHINIETHIFGIDADLYSKNAIVSFIDKIRGEQKFASVEELAARLEKDKEYANKYIEEKLSTRI